MDYDSRIISSGGNSSGGGGTLDYLATNHNFHGTLSLNGNTVATTNQIPSLNDVQNQLNILSVQTAQMSNYALLSGAAFTGSITVNGSTPLYSIPNTVAMLSGAAFTGAITVNGSAPLYSLPNTVALLSGAAFTGGITVNGLTPLYSIPTVLVLQVLGTSTLVLVEILS